MQVKKVRYTPQIFNVTNIQEAKSIILTPEGGIPTNERWEKETAYLTDSIGEFLQPNPDSLILDYGCGIGRLAKVLIERYGCSVVGVDMSQSMQQIAPSYVQDNRFSIVSPEVLRKMVHSGLRIDGCLAVWILQHCPQVEMDIELIHTALKGDGLLYVLNNNTSSIPTDAGFINDGKDLRTLLRASFQEIKLDKLPCQPVFNPIIERTFIGHYRRV